MVVRRQVAKIRSQCGVRVVPGRSARSHSGRGDPSACRRPDEARRPRAVDGRSSHASPAFTRSSSARSVVRVVHATPRYSHSTIMATRAPDLAAAAAVLLPCAAWQISPRRADRSGDARTDGRRRRVGRRPHHPRSDRRDDRLRQDRSRHRAHRGGAARRRPDAADRPEGRPHQPLPHLPRAAPPPTSSRGSTTAQAQGGRRVVREFAAAAGADVDRRPGRLGLGPADIAALRRRGLHDLHPGSQSGVPLNIVGSLQVAGGHRRRRGRRRRDRGLRQGLLGLVGIDADPLSSREHILLSNLIPTSGRRGAPRPADAGRHGPDAADPQARRVRPRRVLPAERPHGARDAAERAARLAVVRRVDERPPARHRHHAATPPTAGRGARSSPPRTWATRSASSSPRSCCRSS